MSTGPILNSTSNTSFSHRVSRIFGQYVINWKFQMKFSLVVFGFMAALSFVLWMMGRVAVDNMVASGLIQAEDTISQLRLLNGIIGKTAVLGLAITFGLSLFFSHFVAGPLYRFEKVLEQMRNGKLNINVSLRKHDELKDIAVAFNQMLASLRNKVKKEREDVHLNIESAIKVAEGLGKTAEAEALRHLLVDLKNLPNQIEV